MRLPFSKPRIIRVAKPLFYRDIFDLKTFEELLSISKTVLECSNAFYAVDPETEFVFRLRKRNFKPSIRQVDRVAYQPDQNIVEIEPKELLELASDLNSELLQTPDSLVLLTSGIVFIASREKR